MTASHSTPTNGKTARMIAQRIAPPVTNGRRRPQRGLHVRSLIAPISGWMIRPVTGPARLRSGSWSGLAPISRKSGFTADWVRPKLNCTPKNPRFIIRMAPVDIGGLRSAWSTPVGAESGVLLAVVVAVMLAPLADAILIEPSGADLPAGDVPQSLPGSCRRPRTGPRMAGEHDHGHPGAHRLLRRASTLHRSVALSAAPSRHPLRRRR